MNTTQALIRRDDAALTVEFTEAALAMKSAALEASALVGKVDDASDQERAVAAQSELAAVLSQAEKARKACKEPILNYGRLIDERHKEFTADLKDEQLRIAKLVGDFQALEQAKARAAEQARLAEERRLAEEKRQAELAAIRAAEAERQKLEAQQREIEEQARKARNEREAKILAEQAAELQRQKALAEAKSHEELDRIQAQHSNAMRDLSDAPRIEPARAVGQRVTEDWEITITDIWLLAKAHPVCVKIEPLKSEIKNLLNAGVKVAGVKAERVTKSGVRATRPLAAIEV